MDEKRYRLPAAPALSLPPEDADRLLALGDGDCALLYLFILRRGGGLAAAAQTLRRSPERLEAAAARLRQEGLLLEEGLPAPAEELPEYRAEDIIRRSREDAAFQALLAETQRHLGHSLSGADLRTLFGIYDRLGLPTEVILLLINRCAQRARQRWGEGRLPTMRAIEKEAFHWANREILTVELAEEYLAALDRREAESEKVLRALQIVGREPTATERRYIDSWLERGYTSAALAIAYDRTVVGTGKLTWAYMDKIVGSWYEKKLFTPEEIEKGDERTTRWGKKPTAGGGGASVGDDLARLEQFLDGNGG